MKALILIIFLTMTGCGQDRLGWESLPILINAQREADFEVIEAWNEYMGFEFFAADKNGVEIVFKKDLGGDGKRLAITHNDYDAGGVLVSSVIEVLPELMSSRNLYFCVMLHEFAHVAGFTDHTDEGFLVPKIEVSTKKDQCLKSFHEDDFLREFFSDFYQLRLQ